MKIPIVMKRACTVSRHDQEQGRSSDRNEIERQEDDEFDDLPQRERRVYGRRHGLAELFDWIASCGIYHPRCSDEMTASLVDQGGVEHVDESLVRKETFKEEGRDSGSLAQNQEGCVQEGKMPAMENGEEGDLGQVGPEEEVCQNKSGQKDTW